MVYFLLIISEQLLLYIPLIIGAYISFTVLNVADLSIESAYVMGAICSTLLLPVTQQTPGIVQLLIMCIVALAAGSIVGFVSSACTRFLKLNHTLSSIITIGLFQGLGYFLLGGGHKTIASLSNPLALISVVHKSPELIMLLCIITIFLFVVSGIIFTQLGYCFAAYGYNARFLESYGISPSFVFISGIMISNACAGLSGYLIAQSNGYIDISMGYGIPLMCFSVLMLGSLLKISSRSISLAIPIVGLIGYICIQQLLLKLGFTSLYFSTAQAIIIVLGVLLRSQSCYFKN